MSSEISLIYVIHLKQKYFIAYIIIYSMHVIKNIL